MTSQEKEIRIRIANAGKLAEASGTIASTAYSLAPSTVEAMVYDEVASEVEKALRRKGAEVDVRVVESLSEKQPESTMFRDIFVGIIGGVGAGVVIMWLAKRRRA